MSANCVYWSALLVCMVGSCIKTEARVKRSDDVPSQQHVVDGLSRQLTQLTAQFTALQNKYTALENRNQQQQQLTEPVFQCCVLVLECRELSATSQKTVLFNVHNSHNPFHIPESGTLVYNTATTNVGNGYDRLTGFFTAPTSGDYVFAVGCLAAHNNGQQHVDLVIDGTTVAYCYSLQGTTSGSSVFAAHLRAGQRVWIKNHNSERNVAGQLWNTFSGILVRADA